MKKGSFAGILGAWLALPLVAFAQFAFTPNFTPNGTNLTVTGFSGSGVVNIPSVANGGLPVTDIGPSLCSNNRYVTDVIIPGSITNIGGIAFDGCTALTNVIIMPNNGLTIGESAFCECQSLTSLSLGEGVTTINETAFQYCTELSLLTIPDSVTNIGESAFQYCYALTNLTLSKQVTSLGADAFNNCTGLVSIVIESPVLNWGNAAFSSCTSLTNLVLSNGVTSVGYDAFDSCTNLANLVFPASLSNIASSAFASCSSLTHVVIPAGVTNVGDNAFGYCSSLARVYFSSSNPTGVAQDAFSHSHPVLYYSLGTPANWISEFSPYYTMTLWNPAIGTGASGFGIKPGGFCFRISGSTNIPILVELCTNLTSGAWCPLLSTNLATGILDFSDSNSVGRATGFYRIGAP